MSMASIEFPEAPKPQEFKRFSRAVAEDHTILKDGFMPFPIYCAGACPHARREPNGFAAQSGYTMANWCWAEEVETSRWELEVEW